MKKRFLFILLTICIILCACGKQEHTSSSPPPTAEPKTIKLTDEIVKEIKSKESTSSTKAALVMTFKDLKDLELTKEEKTDSYTYTFYYKIYFNNNKSSNCKVIYVAYEDTSTEKGYTLNKSFDFK